MAVVGPCLGGQESAAVADAAAVAVPAQAGDDSIAKAKEIIEKLKANNLALQED